MTRCRNWNLEFIVSNCGISDEKLRQVRLAGVGVVSVETSWHWGHWGTQTDPFTASRSLHSLPTKYSSNFHTRDRPARSWRWGSNDIGLYIAREGKYRNTQPVSQSVLAIRVWSFVLGQAGCERVEVVRRHLEGGNGKQWLRLSTAQCLGRRQPPPPPPVEAESGAERCKMAWLAPPRPKKLALIGGECLAWGASHQPGPRNGVQQSVRWPWWWLGWLGWPPTLTRDVCEEVWRRLSSGGQQWRCCTSCVSSPTLHSANLKLYAAPAAQCSWWWWWWWGW